MSGLKYNSGFGNEFATEALKDALPARGNNPQKPAHGLYAEQLSGSAFTAPRHQNLRTWLYRIYPSVKHGAFAPYPHNNIVDNYSNKDANPNQLRWSAPALPAQKTDFIDGLVSFCGNGGADNAAGLGVYLYTANASMDGRYFYNADGELLIVPQMGDLDIHTEMGRLHVETGEICVIPKGIKFQVMIENDARGYVCENFGAPFVLPELGPIGANGLANARDFEYPLAAFEDRDGDFQLLCKYSGKMFQADIDHSPLNVVGWHGNYAPYKYDLSKFSAVNSVSFDQSDPSIFTVLTSPSTVKGVANVDFVVFPPRWIVAEDTFRPPYFHRNCMSEFMGLIHGMYDGKEGGGFEGGGSSLHNRFSAHGPDAKTVDKAMNSDLKPQKIEGALAFMFESSFAMHPTEAALTSDLLQRDYQSVWQGIPKYFK